MKQVLLFTLEYPPDRGGVATYLYELHRNLPKVVVLRARLWWLWPRWLRMIGQLYWAVRKNNIEIVAISHVLPVGYVALVIKRFLKTPYIIFTHGLDVQLATRTSWKKYWFQKIISNADQVVANSDYTKSLLVEQGISRDRILVIYPCVRTIASGRAGQKHGQTLLSVGRLVSRKNHQIVLSALPSLVADFPELQYVIIGDGPECDRLRTQIRDLGLKERVTMVTNPSDEDRDHYYEISDIFVLPARSTKNDVEGFGIVFLEAARFGLPVVAAHGGGVDEAVINGETGILVHPNKKQELEDALRQLLGDSQKARQMGELARVRIEQKFLCGARIVYMQKLYD